jgi:hypothetical protein
MRSCEASTSSHIAALAASLVQSFARMVAITYHILHARLLGLLKVHILAGDSVNRVWTQRKHARFVGKHNTDPEFDGELITMMQRAAQ